MPVLQMALLEVVSTVKCRYWKMRVGTESAGTGKCRYWKMPVLEVVSTVKCR